MAEFGVLCILEDLDVNSAIFLLHISVSRHQLHIFHEWISTAINIYIVGVKILLMCDFRQSRPVLLQLGDESDQISSIFCMVILFVGLLAMF